jgi:hypothetical protein
MNSQTSELETHSTCIYCRQAKRPEEFNSEHVVHASMTPGFQQNLTLLTQVCEECNTYFGRFHDTQLARETVHGIDRIQHGLSPASKLGVFRGRQVQLQTDSENSDLDGVPAVPLDVDGQLAFAMRAHVILEMADGTSRRYFLEDLRAADLENATGRVKVFAATEQAEIELWNEVRGIFAGRGQNLEVAGQYIPGTIPVFAEVEFVERDFRTFSKIAFNYLAKVTVSAVNYFCTRGQLKLILNS